MAIYHLEAKVISRGAGRSAVAAAAYMSCSQITNEYDGVQHDYTRKQGLVWQQIFLSEYAPPEWTDRAVLWNAVEENEKTKDSRLAREFVVALPIEMDKAEWQQLLTDFIQENLVADGMCADVAIHDTDGHNPHAHIMVTVRPLDENGKWQYKTEKEYLCIRDGEERGFTGAEFKQAQKEGWEKQYQYKVSSKKEYMTPSAAEAVGYERASKTPKSTRFGRQNPIAARWNSDEQLLLWRSAWADVTNRHLEQIGAEARIDHRSHADRGLLEQPTVHEGVAARGLESLRQKMVVYRYQFLHFRSARWQAADELRDVKPDLKRFDELVAEIKVKTRERKRLTDEKKQTPVWNLLKKNELTKHITQLTEELEELRSEKTRLLTRFAYTEDKEMKQAKDWAKLKEKAIDDLSAKVKQCETALDDALAEFQQLSQKADVHDPDELWAERLKLREKHGQGHDGSTEIPLWQ